MRSVRIFSSVSADRQRYPRSNPAPCLPFSGVRPARGGARNFSTRYCAVKALTDGLQFSKTCSTRRDWHENGKYA